MDENEQMLRELLSCYLTLDQLKDELKESSDKEKWWYWTAADGPWSHFREDYKKRIAEIKEKLGIK